jgi:hypothetical protein
VIEYGIVTEEKFAEKADKFTLYPTTDGKYFLWDELVEKIKPAQTDKDNKLVVFTLPMLMNNTATFSLQKIKDMKFFY